MILDHIQGAIPFITRMSIRECTKGALILTFTYYIYTNYNWMLCTCMEDLKQVYNICTCMVGSLIEAHLFGSMEEDEECDYDHTLIDDSSAQGGDKEDCNVGEDN